MPKGSLKGLFGSSKPAATHGHDRVRELKAGMALPFAVLVPPQKEHIEAAEGTHAACLHGMPTYMHTHAHNTFTHAYTHIITHTHTHTHTHINTHNNTHTHTHTHTHTYAHTHMHAHTHTHTHTCTSTQAHT